MLNSAIVIKLKQRINKLDSQDYDNIECWQAVEAFNKAQVEWCRRQLHGLNVVKEGDVRLIYDGAFHKVINDNNEELYFVCVFDGGRNH